MNTNTNTNTNATTTATSTVPPVVVSLRKNSLFYLITGLLVVGMIVLLVLDNVQQDLDESVVDLATLIVMGVLGGVYVALLWLHWTTFKISLRLQDSINRWSEQMTT